MLKLSNISNLKHFHSSFSYLKIALMKHFWNCVLIDEIIINPCSDVLIIVKKFQTNFLSTVHWDHWGSSQNVAQWKIYKFPVVLWQLWRCFPCLNSTIETATWTTSIESAIWATSFWCRYVICIYLPSIIKM